MDEFIRVGVDLGKGYFQIHALTGAAAVSRKLSRPKVRTFFARLAPCRIGMESLRGSAHYWARELAAMGHEVVLMPPAYIKPYVKRGKNDALDAAAICEADRRQRPRPGGVQVGTRLRGLAGADAKAELERRQGEARRHHQAGQSIHSQDAGCRLHLGAARRRQTQRRSRRLDRHVAGEKAGAPGRGGARQQAGQDLLGDHDHRRGLPARRCSPERRAKGDHGRATAF